MYGSIRSDLAMVIKGATNLPLIIDYIQSALKVTYVFSLLVTLQSAKQASWHETEYFSVSSWRVQLKLY